ncbi:putative RNA recognition motif (RRM, RBD, or RNP domain) [Leishmania utingensis]|uniref:RNA recognition motif (RRM, RBD, or RNP domain) n=1 Tax=Leishmania utingensis TaxID=653362 RepID=A0AAW3A589_9TRYP
MSSDQGDHRSEMISAEDQFNFDMDAEAELEEMKRQVDSLQEDMQLKALQESAAKDEGTRKTAAAVGGSSGQARTNTSIFVGDLDLRTTDADLRVFFASCGAITRVTVLKDRQGNPKGTAYVEFETEAQAQAAVLKDGQSLHGKPLRVAMKRDNIPAFQRGLPRGGAYIPRGRGAGNPMQQQMAALAMMAGMMTQGFNPYSMSRGRGRGRGRGGY